MCEKKHDIKIFWHYFAAMHGKGVVDGVGAAVKRMASNKVRAEDAKISNAETFAKFLHSCEVRVWWLSEKGKARRNVDIGLKKIIATSKKFKNISKNHYFSVINATVQIQRLSPLESDYLH